MARLGGAAALLVSGLVHLQLYLDGYRDFPNANLGRSFVLQAVAAVAVAVALVLVRHAAVRLAGIVLLLASLVAFAVSRTDRGIFGLVEVGFSPSPQALTAVLSAIVGVVLLAATFVRSVGPGERLDTRAAGVAAMCVVLVAVVGAAMWSRTAERSTAAVVSSPTVVPTSTTAAPPTTPAAPAATGSTMPNMSMPPSDPVAATTTTAPATQPATAPPADDVVIVRIVDFAFDAPTIEVPVGTTVRWVNEDSFAHSVVADDGSFASDTMDSGDVFEFTFDTAGEFAYICGIHPSMAGTVSVTG